MEFLGQNIAVIGMGKSGIASVRLLRKLGANVLAVNSGNVEKWKSSLSEFSDIKLVSQEDASLGELLLKMNLIVLSPGIAREIEILEQVHAKKISVISEIELAYRALKNDLSKIISVTGTNGKTTTVTLIDLLARGAGQATFLGGNIGTPFADYAYEVLSKNRAKADLIILELSSFQLESMETFKSDTAAILNITPSHGERYKNVRDYAHAKFNIADRLNEEVKLFVGDLGKFEKELRTNCFIERLHAPESVSDISVNLIDSFHLIGSHNLSNLLFATKLLSEVAVSWELGTEALKNFYGVKYRLQKRDSRKGLLVYNDAKSTNWEATFTALKAFAFSHPRVEIDLILGGQLRGSGDAMNEKAIFIKSLASKVYLFGEAGKALYAEVGGKLNCVYFEKLDQVVLEIKKDKRSRGVLFSPAFPSFDQYDNYLKRGEHFDALTSENLVQ
ncbi:UDP-N-acetylmuramoyl-L-alanine--D-glutamate ligase [Halobacteriovorax sp. HLS]|uniref:UDP-N-acetylmuramoyl-L-alanine--D-glutamate ligase n=1 Tax=Halobacteriovorax sp. HLS TaxID=2234000 RepID=UPI0013E33F01|nr:UDP-N-acetylmuramoyl-L-alanine--D-glutamate ligase [Halobacteriovorax sp. HLS]